VRNYQTGLAHNETVELATSKEIVLEIPTARVSGRAVDATDRQPLSGVSVVLDGADSGAAGMLPTHTASTDLDGRFVVENLADGNWTLTANREGYAAVSMTVPVLHGKDADGLQLSMEPTEGLILEARLPSGAPPDELSVAVLNPSGGALVSGRYATGENGRVRLSSVPAGEWRLVVSAGGSATSNLQARAPGPAVPVQLQPASGLRLHVPELSDPSSVATARIVGADGMPFTALSWSAQPRSEWRMTGGRLEFGSLPPGSWSVNVAAPDGRSWQATAVTTAGSTASLELE
jgi:hypothetical protein